MGFVRRMATTGKVPISEEVRKEVEMTYFHSIVTTIENKKIPKSLVINLDQTPSKYVPGCYKTLAPKGVKNVSIAGSTVKRTITATTQHYHGWKNFQKYSTSIRTDTRGIPRFSQSKAL